MSAESEIKLNGSSSNTQTSSNVCILNAMPRNYFHFHKLLFHSFSLSLSLSLSLIVTWNSKLQCWDDYKKH